MASSTVVEEADVLNAVRDFLEHSGHVECMRILEKSAGIYPRDVSEEMQFLRELTLDGRWKEVRDFIEVLADTEHRQAYDECRYEVTKQQYLEAMQAVPWDHSLLEQAMQHLEELRATKPSEEVYSKLEQFLPVTSASGYKTYSECEKYRNRLQCFHVLLSSLLSVLYPGQVKAAHKPCSTPLSQDRLCLLLVKGCLFEECENTCRERCGHGLPLGALHLGSWIRQLPDAAFSRELFTTLSIEVNPHTLTTASRPTEPGEDKTSSTFCTIETPTTHVAQGMAPPPSSKNRPQSPHAHSPDEGVVVSSMLKVASTPAHSSALRFENDFVQHMVATPTNRPLDKHISSTPKHAIPLAPPPTSSPVPYVLGTHGLHDTPHLSHCTTITSKGAIREWPSVTLRGTVTDTQVVRAVAFSHSGELVAVGSNSRTVRILSTKPLTSSKSLGELEPLVQLKAHHKGSIYCLAWFQDRILASGSNDQTIKLIEYGSAPLQAAKRLTVHNGTVRDLNFLEDGYLISGGTGDCALKLSQCASLQCVHSFLGHTEEILAVCPLEGTQVASGGADRTVRLWDTRQHSQAGTLRLPSGVGSLTSFQTHLAAATLAGECLVYDRRTLTLLSTVQPHTDECRSVSYSPEGSWLLTGSYDGQVTLVCTQSMEWKVVRHEGDKVIQCRWHSSPQLFSTTGAQKRACFWALQ